MKRLRMLVVPAVLIAVGLAWALPAQARAGSMSGVVVAKQKARGTLLVAGAQGVGFTIRGRFARVHVGDRVAVRGVRLHDGTVHASKLRVVSHVRRTTLRGTVVRRTARGTLVASAHSVVLIHRRSRRLASASDHGDRDGLEAGDVARFRIRFDDDDLFEEGQPVQLGQAGTARIEGTIVSLSPFVVSLEGLPLTITVPGGTTLPSGLAPGQRIELTVQVGNGNTFTLVAIDEVENENEAQEVEVKGFVTSSTASQIVVNANGVAFTFVPPAGATLPVLATGTFVEARGLGQNGTITLTRLRVDDQGDDGGGGGGGGGDDGGGHH
jgi:hypothetical protein